MHSIHSPPTQHPQKTHTTGGRFNAKYALRFAAGFGSQVAFALYGHFGSAGSEDAAGVYYSGHHAAAAAPALLPASRQEEKN